MSTTTVTKMRPWAATPRDHAMTATPIALAMLATFIIVAATPMKGKLA
jgi:phosphate transport system permease protein